MADTLNCYNENEKCEDCNNAPVTIQHWGELTNNELKKLCTSCLKKREEKLQNKNKFCQCPMGSGKFGLKPGVVNGICCKCHLPINESFVRV
jgi:hypothetical protein